MTEKWDLFDFKRHPLNRTHDRNMKMNKGEFHQVVEIWTLNSRHEILLTLRHPDKRDYPNLWENTGGSVLSGESSLEGAVRELHEETGIETSGTELRYLDSWMEKTYFLDTYALTKDIEISSLKMQEGETSDAQWVSQERLLQMISEDLLAAPVVERYKRVASKLSALLDNV